MLECLIIGDSIAVGMQPFLPQCNMQAKGGITSTGYNRRYKVLTEARYVIISLGSNDNPKYNNTLLELENLRKTIESKKVYWIFPAINKPDAKHAVLAIAKKYNDTILEIPGTYDGIHPTTKAYKQIKENITP